MKKNKTMEHISNEQKAKEISQSVSFFWTNEDDGEKSIIDTASLRKAIFNAAMQAMEWKDEENTEFLTKIKNVFEGIAQRCDKLTSGNIAHERAHLKGYVEGLAKMIERHLKGE